MDPQAREVLRALDKQVETLTGIVRELEAENRVLRSTLRELACHVSEEAWKAVIDMLSGIQPR